MSPGRCAGCGEINTSCKVIKNHVLGCAQYVELYHVDSVKCLDPESEYRRWREDEGSPESRQLERSAKAAKHYRDSDLRRAAAEARWATPVDPLEGD